MLENSSDNKEYPDWESFHSAVIDYLLKESQYVEEDIQSHNELSVEERELMGLLVQNAVRIDKGDDDSIHYSTPVNYTKLRPGDEVRIREFGTDGSGRVAIVENNAIEEISFSLVGKICKPSDFPLYAEIVVKEQNNLDILISVVRDIRDGGRGANFVQCLGGFAKPRLESRFSKITDFSDAEIPESFNESQRKAVHMAMRRPSMAYVQGTPGSGKTHLLSVVAKSFARRAKDVVVIALTHQAVNNALNKICSVDAKIPIVKIGKVFKNYDLDSRIQQAESFYDYISSRKASNEFYGDVGHVVGMTFQSALYNLGKMRSPFIPQIILFDEAGQVPLTHAIAVGAFGCGSVVFIGDDVQMPPIYHEKLVKDPLSLSIFERIKSLHPNNGQVLDVTYRMNKEISQFVSDNFYKPKGINLSCSPLSAQRHLDSPNVEFKICNSLGSTDENKVEAMAAVEMVNRYLNKGLSPNRIAVITPYRRQVRRIYKLLSEAHTDDEELPLVDTVERLQGQDVDVIVISFSVDDELYFSFQKSFIMNPNRLNVMFSRATSKVVLICSDLVKEELSSLIWRRL
jgi:adenylylsulfate kinase-like enzyme